MVPKAWMVWRRRGARPSDGPASSRYARPSDGPSDAVASIAAASAPMFISVDVAPLMLGPSVGSLLLLPLPMCYAAACSSGLSTPKVVGRAVTFQEKYWAIDWHLGMKVPCCGPVILLRDESGGYYPCGGIKTYSFDKNMPDEEYMRFHLTTCFDIDGHEVPDNYKLVSLRAEKFQGYGIRAASMPPFDKSKKKDASQMVMLRPFEFLKRVNCYKVSNHIMTIDNNLQLSNPFVPFHCDLEDFADMAVGKSCGEPKTSACMSKSGAASTQAKSVSKSASLLQPKDVSATQAPSHAEYAARVSLTPPGGATDHEDDDENPEEDSRFFNSDDGRWPDGNAAKDTEGDEDEQRFRDGAHDEEGSLEDGFAGGDGSERQEDGGHEDDGSEEEKNEDASDEEAAEREDSYEGGGEGDEGGVDDDDDGNRGSQKRREQSSRATSHDGPAEDDDVLHGTQRSVCMRKRKMRCGNAEEEKRRQAKLISLHASKEAYKRSLEAQSAKPAKQKRERTRSSQRPKKKAKADETKEMADTGDEAAGVDPRHTASKPGELTNDTIDTTKYFFLEYDGDGNAIDRPTQVFGDFTSREKEMALEKILAGHVVVTSGMAFVKKLMNMKNLYVEVRRERYMVRMFNYVLFKIEQRSEGEWNDKFFIDYDTIMRRFAPRGLTIEKWEETKSNIVAKKTIDVPKRLGGVDEARLGKGNVGGYKVTTAIYMECPYFLKLFVHEILGAVEQLRDELRRISSNAQHIMWDKRKDHTTYLPVCITPMDALHPAEDLTRVVRKLSCHLAVLDLAPLKNLDAWSEQRFHELRQMMTVLCGSHWALIIFSALKVEETVLRNVFSQGLEGHTSARKKIDSAAAGGGGESVADKEGHLRMQNAMGDEFSERPSSTPQPTLGPSEGISAVGARSETTPTAGGEVIGDDGKDKKIEEDQRQKASDEEGPKFQAHEVMKVVAGNVDSHSKQSQGTHDTTVITAQAQGTDEDTREQSAHEKDGGEGPMLMECTGQGTQIVSESTVGERRADVEGVSGAEHEKVPSTVSVRIPSQGYPPCFFVSDRYSWFKVKYTALGAAAFVNYVDWMVD
ncbi:hypothetical protein CBR_g45881 [Chara braunii]|uniref:Uncharacterized protein n=1 Tax=Chara braunii TaxID=69332 RepID=A0A388LZI4_CHABU|nr:hypothetical protein CBR_g45881 [Chara braunii]|eukprot:GBG87727.1 hypothetical protein CBR_g45881 [Chara braunii]